MNAVRMRSRRTLRQLVRLASRDGGWICHLCGESIDPHLDVHDPRGASRDHLIPKSAGGPSYLRNYALAHRECNEARGASPLEEVPVAAGSVRSRRAPAPRSYAGVKRGMQPEP